MADSELIARVRMEIDAPVGLVWNALVDPKAIKEYMLGAEAISDWKEGSTIVWKGEWKGKSYEDKGRILRIVPERMLQYTHFSPLAGLPDSPESYHVVTIELSHDGSTTTVSLSQTNNKDRESLEHNENGWRMVLEGLKRHVERVGS